MVPDAELLPILTKRDITHVTQDINRRPARPNARVVVGGGGLVKCQIRQVTGDRAANSAHSHNGIQFVADVQLDGPAITTQLQSPRIEFPQLNGCRPHVAADPGTTPSLCETDVTANADDAHRALNLTNVDRAADADDGKIDISWETQQHAMPNLDYSVLAHRFALYEQITRYLPRNDFVAIQLSAAARRSLDLDACRVAINSLDVNAAVNGNHFNPSFSWESKASIDFIALLIGGRPYGRCGQGHRGHAAPAIADDRAASGGHRDPAGGVVHHGSAAAS